MTTVCSTPIICPKCNKKFRTTLVFSYGYKTKTTDLRPLYWGFNPMPLWVARCPFCSFADFSNNFISSVSKKIETIEDIWEDQKRRKEELKVLKNSLVTNGASERFEIAERYAKEGVSPGKVAEIFKEAVDAIRMNATSPSPFTFKPTLNAPTIQMDIECARKFAHAFEISSDPKNIIYAYIAAEHYRLAAKFELAIKWYQIFKDAVKYMEDPPITLKLVNLVENEARRGNSDQLMIEETDVSIFIRGFNI